MTFSQHWVTYMIERGTNPIIAKTIYQNHATSYLVLSSLFIYPQVRTWCWCAPRSRARFTKSRARPFGSHQVQFGNLVLVAKERFRYNVFVICDRKCHTDWFDELLVVKSWGILNLKYVPIILYLPKRKFPVQTFLKTNAIINHVIRKGCYD